MLDFLLRDRVKSVNINDMDDLIGKISLIDIREPYEYLSGSLKSAKNIPMNLLLGNPDKYLRKDAVHYLFCQSGARSRRASTYLAKLGFEVINVSGGMGAYVGSKRK